MTKTTTAKRSNKQPHEECVYKKNFSSTFLSQPPTLLLVPSFIYFLAHFTKRHKMSTSFCGVFTCHRTIQQVNPHITSHVTWSFISAMKDALSTLIINMCVIIIDFKFLASPKRNYYYSHLRFFPSSILNALSIFLFFSLIHNIFLSRSHSKSDQETIRAQWVTIYTSIHTFIDSDLNKALRSCHLMKTEMKKCCYCSHHFLSLSSSSLFIHFRLSLARGSNILY